jgi:Holliday junction resolvase
MNSRTKGKRGELEWRDWLRANGCPDARRGQQFSGTNESPDVVGGWPGTHAEVKRVEALNLYAAMEQACGDCGGSVPYVAHRRNGKPWLVTVKAEDLMTFARLVLRLP